MATWTLSDLNDLGCKGQCDQGRKPCNCINTINVKEGEAFFSYTAPQMPCVIVDSGASIPIPFYGWFTPTNENL